MSFKQLRIGTCVAMAVTLSMFAAARPSAGPRPGASQGTLASPQQGIQHVQLISIDGMHALGDRPDGPCSEDAGTPGFDRDHHHRQTRPVARRSASVHRDPQDIAGRCALRIPPRLRGERLGPTEDDVSLLWLTDSSQTSAAVATLEGSGTAAGLGQIFYGPSLETMYNKPGLPADGGDSRTPDIIVQPNVGVIYSGSSKKQAEHGGFAHDDTNVMMLVANPHLHARAVTSFVETTQVAPTILSILGLDPNSLDAVQKEGTPVLPGLEFEN